MLLVSAATTEDRRGLRRRRRLGNERGLLGRHAHGRRWSTLGLRDGGRRWCRLGLRDGGRRLDVVFDIGGFGLNNILLGWLLRRTPSVHAIVEDQSLLDERL